MPTLYTAKFWEEPSSSGSSGPSAPRSNTQPYLDRLFETHIALNQMEDVPSSRPTTPDPAERERVEELRIQVIKAFENANGNASSGKWGILVNLLQTGTATGNYRYMNARSDRVPPKPGPEGWPPLAETEEEWHAWEKKWKDQRILTEKVENWQRDIDSDINIHPDEPEPLNVGPPDFVVKLGSDRANSVSHLKSTSHNTAASRLRIADVPEEPFLPPSFPDHLQTSTPPVVNRYKPAPIELVPSSSPVSPLPNEPQASVPGPSKPPLEVIPSSSPTSPKNTRVYGRPRALESPLKRERSPSPTPLTPAKKSRVAASPSSGSLTPLTPSPRKPDLLKASFATTPRNNLPKLADLIAASEQRKKAKAKDKGKGKERPQFFTPKTKTPPLHKPPKPKPRNEEPEEDPVMEADLNEMADKVINWEATMDKAEGRLANTNPLPSPTKSLSSIDGSDSLESMPDFSNGEAFAPIGASTQPLSRLEAGESLGTTERGMRGFGQPVDDEYGFQSQMDVESNVQGVEKLLVADVGAFGGPWMGRDEDDEEEERLDSSP